VPVFPLSGFRLLDLVIVESYLELLRDAASTGTEAAAVIRRSLESLR
jgi:hypothetical protein